MNKSKIWKETYTYLHDYYTDKDYQTLIHIAQHLHLPYPLDLFPRTINLAQSTYYMNRKARTATNRILSKLNNIPDNYIKSHLFTELITFKNQPNISKTEVKQMNNDINKLRLKQKRNGINTLIDSNEALIDQRQYFNQHTHGLLLTTHNSSATRLTNYYTNWVNKYQNSNHNYKVIIKRFQIKKPTLKDSIKSFIHYALKQYRLPYLKTQHEQNNYERLPLKQRKEVLYKLINAYKSTRTAYIMPNNAKLQLNLTEINKYIITKLLTLKYKKSGSQKYSHISNTYLIKLKPNNTIQQQQQAENKGNIVINKRFSGIPP